MPSPPRIEPVALEATRLVPTAPTAPTAPTVSRVPRRIVEEPAVCPEWTMDDDASAPVPAECVCGSAHPVAARVEDLPRDDWTICSMERVDVNGDGIEDALMTAAQTDGDDRERTFIGCWMHRHLLVAVQRPAGRWHAWSVGEGMPGNDGASSANFLGVVETPYGRVVGVDNVFNDFRPMPGERGGPSRLVTFYSVDARGTVTLTGRWSRDDGYGTVRISSTTNGQLAIRSEYGRRWLLDHRHGEWVPAPRHARPAGVARPGVDTVRESPPACEVRASADVALYEQTEVQYPQPRSNRVLPRGARAFIRDTATVSTDESDDAAHTDWYFVALADGGEAFVRADDPGLLPRPVRRCVTEGDGEALYARARPTAHTH